MSSPSPNRKYESSVVNKPALRFMEKKPDSVDIQSIKNKAKSCLKNNGKATDIEISRIYTGSEGHRYFYMYFRTKNDKDRDSIFDDFNKEFQQLMQNTLSIYYNGNTLKEIFKKKQEDEAPPPQASTVRFNTKTNVLKVGRKKQPKETVIAHSKQSTTKNVEDNHTIKSGKTIRIDINMKDINDFLLYLRNREPNRHNRQRYLESLKSLYYNGWNDYRHSTFIDDNKYKVNPRDIEIFVNGIKSDDFRVSVKEYTEALELYLTYRWEKEYERSNNSEKSESVPPIVKERKGDEEIEAKTSEEEKKIFTTINHLESWKSEETEKQSADGVNPSVKYVGGVQRKRRTRILRSASISEEETKLNITLNLDETKEEIQEPETPATPSNDKVMDIVESPVEYPVDIEPSSEEMTVKPTDTIPDSEECVDKPSDTIVITEEKENIPTDNKPIENKRAIVKSNNSSLLLILTKGIYNYIKIMSKDMLNTILALIKRLHLYILL